MAFPITDFIGHFRVMIFIMALSDFRHLKATTLLNRGANLSEVQDLLGHASPDTTKRIYAHYETSKLREAFDQFSQSADEAAAMARRTRTPAGSV